MTDESLADLLDRLERERADADRRYNDALTALDRAVPAPLPLPDGPAPYDDSQIAALNERWDVVPETPASLRAPVKGRLRRFVWNLVGPVFGAQKRFNAALVDHLNRNIKPHHDAQLAAGAALDGLRRSLDASARLHVHLIQYLQTVTLFVDTRDRAVGGQARVVAAGLSAVTDDAIKRHESIAARVERLAGRLDGLGEVRATASLAQQTALSLKREVERLMASGPARQVPATDAAASVPAPPPALDAYKYVGFEDAFRGSREEIRGRLADYVARFEGLSDVVDVGCGRGEFLGLLRERGITARGVDLNHEMVETARAQGLDVTEGDALSFLQGLDDGSVGAVFGAQVAEHLEPAYLDQLVEVAHEKLRPGGLLVLETINPASWSAFFDSYLRDLTHVRPLHPETLQYVLRANGFSPVEIEYRSPLPPHVRLETAPFPEDARAPVADLVRAFNDNVEKLNNRMFACQDYAVIGRKPGQSQ